MKKYKSLSITNTDDLIFGRTPNPVKCGNNLVIGAGTVFPEINFTLPSMLIEKTGHSKILEEYRSISQNILNRAKIQRVPGLVVEFEELPPMTADNNLSASIINLLKEDLNNFYKDTGIPNALRVTVVDMRDKDHPPMLRSGESLKQTLDAVETAARNGADIISIESVGGKEVHDQALLFGDLTGIVCSLGILGVRDVDWLWQQITGICSKFNCIPGGDTACGFANTAMQLAGQGMLPSILAALVRAASAPRSLAACSAGATGPFKDCAYEGPIIKAITGIPISMEGKSSCCAHFSPLGNIAGAAADLWSNESVQNIRLLSGSAPEAFMELLSYDCRLFNTTDDKNRLIFRDLMVNSDLTYSPEAYMLEPNTVISIAEAIVNEDKAYNQTISAVRTAISSLNSAVAEKRLLINETEKNWLCRFEEISETFPENEETAVRYLSDNYGSLFLKYSYGLD